MQRKAFTSISQKLGGVQKIIDDEGFEHVELKVSLAAMAMAVSLPIT